MKCNEESKWIRAEFNIGSIIEFSIILAASLCHNVRKKDQESKCNPTK